MFSAVKEVSIIGVSELQGVIHRREHEDGEFAQRRENGINVILRNGLSSLFKMLL